MQTTWFDRKTAFITGGAVFSAIILLTLFVPAFRDLMLFIVATIYNGAIWLVFTQGIGMIAGGLIVAGVWAAKRWDDKRARKKVAKEKKEVYQNEPHYETPIGITSPGTGLTPVT